MWSGPKPGPKAPREGVQPGIGGAVTLNRNTRCPRAPTTVMGYRPRPPGGLERHNTGYINLMPMMTQHAHQGNGTWPPLRSGAGCLLVVACTHATLRYRMPVANSGWMVCYAEQIGKLTSAKPFHTCPHPPPANELWRTWEDPFRLGCRASTITPGRRAKWKQRASLSNCNTYRYAGSAGPGQRSCRNPLVHTLCGTWHVAAGLLLRRCTFFSVERFTGKETGRDRPAGVQGPTSTGKHQHVERRPGWSECVFFFFCGKVYR